MPFNELHRNEDNQLTKQPLRVVFFGDSICFGQGVSLHLGWVTRISAELDGLGRSAGREVVVVNCSVNGSTTRQALERMPYDVQSHGVDVMIVQFGMNDCNHWLTDKGLPRVSVAGFEANLQEIIDRGIASGAQKIILNCNHPTTRNADFMHGIDRPYESNNKKYNTVVRKVAGANPKSVVLNDMESSFQLRLDGGQKLRDLLLDDGLHLSVSGHDAYYAEISPIIVGEIERIISE